MPGFHLPDRTVTLVFEEGPLVGLELEVRLSIALDDFFTMQQLMAKAADKTTGLETLRDLYRFFAERMLIGWNLTNGDGKPVPPTPDAFTATLDPASGWAMIVRYISQIGGQSDSLAPRSGAGSTSKGRRGSKNRRS